MFLDGIYYRYYTIFSIVRGMKRFVFEYIPAWLLLMVFGFIVVHAPLTVWVGAHVPSLAVTIKSWKELLTGLAAILVIIALYRRHMLGSFTAKPVVAALLVYIALHLMAMGIYPHGVHQTVAGLMIDLRYVAYFLTVYAFLHLYPQYRQPFIRVGIVGAVIVVGFAVMELFLPKNTLSLLGYGNATIQPYLTVDKNPNYIRYNSTLRGPNPLGAYAIMVLAGAVAYAAMARRRLAERRTQVALGLLLVASAVALWVSYSRSAVIGAVIALGVVAWVVFGLRLSKKLVYAAIVAVVVAGGLLYAARNTSFVQNVVVHNNPTTGAAIDSNTAHAESLMQGLQRVAVEPLGAGIGSTGSASLFGSSSMVIENQYLMIAHEVGWMGLALFVYANGLVLVQLYRRRADWLALAAFSSGIGLAVVGLMLPVWADDTVSIVWWGLAAIALIGGTYGRSTTNKKAKRTA